MRISLATRIFMGYAVVLITFGAVCIFSITEMQQNQLELRLVSDGYLHLAQSAASIETFQRNHERDSRRQEASAQNRRDMVRLARLFLEPKLEEAERRTREVMSFAPSSEIPFLEQLKKQFATLRQRYVDYETHANTLVTLDETQTAQFEEWTRQLNQTESALGREMILTRHGLEERIRQRVAQAELRERRAGWTIIGLSVFAIAMGLLMTALAARALRPVKQLIESVSRVGKGDYSAQLRIRGDDEIAILAREFDAMASSLKDREKQLGRQQEALLRAEQLAAVGRVSAQVAHEVRNPLSSIGLNAEMLADALSKVTFASETDAQETKNLLASVSREVDRLNAVTEQYLGLARLPVPVMEAEDINQVLESILRFSSEELTRAKVTVNRQFSATECRAFFDESQIRQVFLNLIRNSREAMVEGGQLTVMSKKRGPEVVVALSDEGPGIPTEVQEKIFEPFFSTKKGGTGLGLALTRQILSAHGGSITCESIPGRGTTFVVKLKSA